ncbi:hypothetical protein [Thalassospira sp. CH_XMU1420-2]|uniref:hypothetical protein n=1 Tax=Thalassospira sp. CH_XMU1420-2 TaxID=3107769 RepID=UPI00300ACB5A
MANQYLSNLHAAAHEMSRPRFATSLVLAMVSLADENGVIHATREELAEMVDRSEHQSRHGERLERVKNRTNSFKKAMARLKEQLSEGTLPRSIYDHEVALLTDEYRKYVRSPTLANVSNVISQFRDLNLMSVSYVDPETGEEFPTTARGRFARYRFVLPTGSMPVFVEDPSTSKMDNGIDPVATGAKQAAKLLQRSAKPINQPPPTTSKSVEKGAHQLSLL